MRWEIQTGISDPVEKTYYLRNTFPRILAEDQAVNLPKVGLPIDCATAVIRLRGLHEFSDLLFGIISAGVPRLRFRNAATVRTRL